MCAGLCAKASGDTRVSMCVYIRMSVLSVGSIGMMRCVMKKNEPVYT